MVAYNFKAQFCEPIATGRKRQTVRGDRARHARPGEPVQLYFGMRTVHCHKIIEPDPICTEVVPIRIFLDRAHEQLIRDIVIGGSYLSHDEIEAFAFADGFGAPLFDGFARRLMGEFWLKTHPFDRFSGVVVRWDPRHG